MLLSGTDAHSAGLGTMAELIAPNQRGKPGYEGVLKPNVATLAERLGSAGYRTILSGKWHLGLTPEQDPSQRGFEQSFTLLQGAHNHFGPGLSTDPAKGATYRENGKTLTALPADFYSSDYFATKLLGFLSESSGSKKPFFAYFAFSAPHWPLQAPASDIAKYKGRYDQGFEVLRAARLKRQAELGLIDPAKPPNPLILKNGGWNKLSVEEKAEQSRAMEVYAAMVDRLDRNVGRVIDYLKRTGQYENTVILFTADNGAEGLDVRNATMDSIKKIAAAADNRLENFGAATSYLSYGPGWAQAATAPSRLYKGYTTEGGTRAVAFITYPGAKRQGAVGTAFGTVQDVVPTFLDLAGVPAADQVAGRPVAPITGRSWAPYLSGTAQTVHGDTNAVSWELFGNRAVRRGDWKITDIGEGKWRLFNLKDDPGETNDLSIDQAERLKLLADAWEDYARRVGVILPSEVAYRP